MKVGYCQAQGFGQVCAKKRDRDTLRASIVAIESSYIGIMKVLQGRKNKFGGLVFLFRRLLEALKIDLQIKVG